MTGDVKIGAIILAAGASSRLGHPKQLVGFKGKTLLQQAIDMADSFGFDPKIVVLGANSEEILQNIEIKNFNVAINKNWAEGMSTSIIRGLSEALKKEKKLAHVLFLLSDQPFVSRGNIEEMIEIHLRKNSRATFSGYGENIGVPAIFSKSVFSELKNLKGDYGAKKLISEKKIDFQTVKFEAGNFDVDTKEDIERLKLLEQQ